ncbi:unnamed protein product [Camellia sinensis]
MGTSGGLFGSLAGRGHGGTVLSPEGSEEKKRTQTPNHIYISPALYTTPAPAPIPDSSFPRSPSPYVVNHKRRGGDAVARRAGGFDETPQLKSPPDGETDSNSNGDVVVVVEELVDDGVCGMETGGEDRDGGSVVAVVDDFFDPRCESVSVGSSAGVDDFGKQGGCPSFLHAIRLGLLEEIEKRKAAEYEAVNREMSQRNQEVMEVAQRQRQRRKTQRQRWLWGCVGLSVAIGTSVFDGSKRGIEPYFVEKLQRAAKAWLPVATICNLCEKNDGEEYALPGGCHTIGFASCQLHKTDHLVHESILLHHANFLISPRSINLA